MQNLKTYVDHFKFKMECENVPEETQKILLRHYITDYCIQRRQYNA